jgi:hypothetical protein
MAQVQARRSFSWFNRTSYYIGLNYVDFCNHFMLASNFCRLYQNINWNNELFQVNVMHLDIIELSYIWSDNHSPAFSAENWLCGKTYRHLYYRGSYARSIWSYAHSSPSTIYLNNEHNERLPGHFFFSLLNQFMSSWFHLHFLSRQLQLKKNTCPDEDVKLCWLQKLNSHN